MKIHPRLRVELDVLHWKVSIARLILSPLPLYFGSRLRTLVLSQVGFVIGEGTLFSGTPTFSGQGEIYPRLRIGENCWFNVGCFFELSDRVTIGDQVSFGHEVMLLTGTHQFGDSHRRCGEFFTCPVTIGNGVWVGSRTTILPGVTIGDGAVIGAGALVNRDVPANTLFAGVPAKMIRVL